MRPLLIFLFLFASSYFLLAQTSLKGSIKDAKSNPIIRANIFIKGTYDGTSSDDNGNFKLALTAETDTLILLVSAIGYELYELEIHNSNNAFSIHLKEKFDILKAVSVSEGSINAIDREKAIILKP